MKKLIILGNKSKCFIWGVLCILITVFLVYFFLYNGRDYYCNVNKSKCITVWDKWGSPNIYLIPGFYKKPFLPSSDYVCSDRRNVITIIWNGNMQKEFVIAWRNNYFIYFNTPNLKVDKINLDNQRERTNYENKYLDSNYHILPNYECEEIDVNR